MDFKFTWLWGHNSKTEYGFKVVSVDDFKFKAFRKESPDAAWIAELTFVTRDTLTSWGEDFRQMFLNELENYRAEQIILGEEQ